MLSPTDNLKTVESQNQATLLRRNCCITLCWMNTDAKTVPESRGRGNFISTFPSTGLETVTTYNQSSERSTRNYSLEYLNAVEFRYRNLIVCTFVFPTDLLTYTISIYLDLFLD